MKTINLLITNSSDGLLKSLFQEDFAYVKKQIAKVLKNENGKEWLFKVVLCEYFEEIKKCENTNLKIIALKNALMALEYLGGQYVE